MDVWAYTGFTFEQLTSRCNPLYLDNVNLLKYIDVLVDGKFIFEEKNIELKFRGSSNQRIINVQKSLADNEVVLKYEFMEPDLHVAK